MVANSSPSDFNMKMSFGLKVPTKKRSKRIRQQSLKREVSRMWVESRMVANSSPSDFNMKMSFGLKVPTKKRSKRIFRWSVPKSRYYFEKFYSRENRIKQALSEFRKLMLNHIPKKSSSGYEVLKFIRRCRSHLFVNIRHSTVGKFGYVPGVEVGDCFSCTAELHLVGLHRLPQSGVDWKEVATSCCNKISIAVSVVVSGGYEDNSDRGDVLVYTGHGGKDRGAKQQTKDQKLVGGNLALQNSSLHQNCCLHQNSIRVIRRRYDPAMPSKRIYSYDGLYKVVEAVVDAGKSGFTVYKFILVRERGQAPLIWSGRTSQKAGRRLPHI